MTAAGGYDGFSLTVAGEGDRTVVRVVGEIDFLNASHLRDTLADIRESRPGDVLVDLAGVTFMDSSGLFVLLAAHRRWHTEGYRFALRRPSAVVQRLFDLARLTALFVVED